MGIPSYFSHILKNYSITKKYKNQDSNNNLLFLDCNSFIYDAINADIKMTNENIFKFVVDRILYFICLLSPKQTYIAFDGVVPMAKMKQQRERRFKSHILKTLDKDNKPIGFDTCQITPGTDFMNQLDHYLQVFVNNRKDLNIVFSGSNNYGEGEHKIFQYIRKTDVSSDTIYIYGLDADLIILSLGHLQYCPNIYLIREDFNNELIELDIKSLQLCIHKEFNPNKSPQVASNDYITLSFLLGNDFLPHSPILNIRTKGIEHILWCYKRVLTTNNKTLSSKSIINWSFFKELSNQLSCNEFDYLKQEVSFREKQQLKKMNEKQKPDIMNIPMINQDHERLLRIDDANWNHRYYQILFNEEYVDECFIQRVCVSYMEGLQWCLAYYSDECIDTEWYYPYAYPPLFSDLIKYIPIQQCNLFPNKVQTIKTQLEQLCIVLPPSSYNLLPLQTQKRMKQYIDFTGFDISNIHLQWDFCTYLWESHPILFPIFQNTIQTIVKNI